MTNPYHDKDKWVSFVQSFNPEIDPRSLRLMDEMRMTARALYHTGENSVTDSGLSYAKYRLLMGLLFSQEVEGRRDLNPSEISERLSASRNSISALIRDLEEEGLVERSLDLKDRRKFNITLTKSGRARVREHVRRHIRIIGRCFGTLNNEEQEALSDYLTRIRRGAMGESEQTVESSPMRTGA